MAYWKDISENFKYFFSAENWRSGWFFLLLQFLLLAVVLYYVFKILWNNHARKFVYIISVVLVVAGVAFLFSGFVAGILLFVVVLIALLVFTMFNTEVKRNLLDSSYRNKNWDKTEAKRSIDEIVAAVLSMSKKRTGAMIILADNNLPNGVKESGTPINGLISAALIESIFFHNSPLHDGSIVIEKNRIVSAGSFVSMDTYDNIAPAYMGARHRASLSIAAQAPVTVIVVSEETGRISVMNNDLPDPPAPGMQLVNGRGERISSTTVLANGQKFIETATEVDLREVLRRYYWDYDLGKEEEALR
ncbi:MAG: DNA integrity scanning protein DisA nucleotide-binding domain protein [Clostridia bacterium]|nr:DNA integrity scanning protein DisA nucleotide-binding domain protein [Clostridia bacterium]